MPVISRSNNRVLPANARASDVAEQAIAGITDVQQMRAYSAFRVQGIQAVLYNHLLSGRKCSCQSSRRELNRRLDKDGKAPPGAINELLTGQLVFTIDPYGVDREANPNLTSPDAPTNKYQGVFEHVGNAEDLAQSLISSDKEFGDNGPFNPTTIDDLVGSFDSSILGFSDAACSICYGTGFVSGYAPFHGNRQVFTCLDVDLVDGIIDYQAKPFKATCEGLHFQVVLPKGALHVDAFRLWNGNKVVPCQILLDGKVSSYSSILQACDGLKHVIEVSGPNLEFTHFEIQFNLSDESAYLEFPRLNKGSDTSFLEQLEPFQIVMSPNIPMLRPQDIIVESMFGKHLIVQNSNWWNTRNRRLLGWECNVRVLQPQELYRLLPTRGRVMQKNQTTNMVRDNLGTRRT